jgi:hypothetical protein
MPQTNSNAGQLPRFGRAPAPLGAASWALPTAERSDKSEKGEPSDLQRASLNAKADWRHWQKPPASRQLPIDLRLR